MVKNGRFLAESQRNKRQVTISLYDRLFWVKRNTFLLQLGLFFRFEHNLFAAFFLVNYWLIMQHFVAPLKIQLYHFSEGIIKSSDTKNHGNDWLFLDNNQLLLVRYLPRKKFNLIAFLTVVHRAVTFYLTCVHLFERS